MILFIQYDKCISAFQSRKRALHEIEIMKKLSPEENVARLLFSRETGVTVHSFDLIHLHLTFLYC